MKKYYLCLVASLFMGCEPSLEKPKFVSDIEHNVQLTRLPMNRLPIEHRATDQDIANAFKNKKASKATKEQKRMLTEMAAFYELKRNSSEKNEKLLSVKNRIESVKSKLGGYNFAQNTAMRLLEEVYKEDAKTLINKISYNQKPELNKDAVEKVKYALEVLVEHQNPNADVLANLLIDLSGDLSHEKRRQYAKHIVSYTLATHEKRQNSMIFRNRIHGIESAIPALNELAK